MDSTSTCSVLHDTKNNKLEANFCRNNGKLTTNVSIRVGLPMTRELALNPGIHKANCDHDNHWFQAKTKLLERWIPAQLHSRFVCGVVVVQFAVNGNQAFRLLLT